MTFDPRSAAEAILGPTRWEEPTAGICKCPGEALHTHPTRSRDCMVRIDGAPTIYCFHTSCAEAVTAANSNLRRALGSAPWELRLPGGHVVRSGQHAPALGLAQVPRGIPCASKLAAVEAAARDDLPLVLEKFEWTYEQIVASSPLAAAHRSPEEQFKLWLRLWPPHATIWVGEVSDSGRPSAVSHFRPIPEWYEIGPVMGNYTCGASFRPATTSRSNTNIEHRHFVIIESDELSRDQVGSIFRLFHKRLGYRLRCIVDTAGKSLHAWFSAPSCKLKLAHMKAALAGYSCDPRMFNASQPARLPGAFRDGKVQSLIWVDL